MRSLSSALAACVLLASMAVEAAETASAPSPLVAECRGCHGEARDEPERRFSNGLGRWNDLQCFGCHAEINDVADKRARGVRDPRYFAVPVSEERLGHLAKSPLSYMVAPERLEPGPVPRLSRPGLEAFLRRPAVVFDAAQDRTPKMIAAPLASKAELDEVWRWLEGDRTATVEPRPALTARRRAAARRIFESRCAPCHAGPAPTSGRTAVSLALYTPEWLEHYASGRGRQEGDGRKMPDIELSLEEARDLHLFFGEARASLERQVDRAVQKLRAPRTTRGENAPGFVPYLFGPFFRDGGCVHCHVSSPRASTRFVASADGLRAYLARNSGEDFWRRLETRAVETELGLGAKQPGMPMAGPAIPAEVRASIARWVVDGCPDPSGVLLCSK